ncbi:hypothetical protein AB5I41_17780 [Sphingomonas sp. MMS24-JH45]
MIALEVGGALALFRDKEGVARFGRIATLALPALAALLLGWATDRVAGELSALLLALGAIGAAAIAERAAGPVTRRGWWGSPPAYLALLALAALPGVPRLGLAVVALYAAATLTAAVSAAPAGLAAP